MVGIGPDEIKSADSGVRSCATLRGQRLRSQSDSVEQGSAPRLVARRSAVAVL